MLLKLGCRKFVSGDFRTGFETIGAVLCTRGLYLLETIATTDSARNSAQDTERGFKDIPRPCEIVGGTGTGYCDHVSAYCMNYTLAGKNGLL